MRGKPSIVDFAELAKHSIVELSKDYTFFTHMPLLLYSDLGFDPVLRYLEENSISDRPIVYNVGHKIFGGLGSLGTGNLHLRQTLTRLGTNIESTLFALPSQIWTGGLEQYLGTITIVDYTLKRYADVVIQKLPLLSSFTACPQTVDILATAIDGNRYCVSFKPTSTGLLMLHVDRPNQNVVEYSAKLLG